MKTIGIVGLGIMGHGIAQNALKGGHKVVVWNRTKSKANDLVKKGAILADSPAKVSELSDIIIEVTANNESSREVWLGNNGVLKAASGSKILITSATLSVKWVEELARHCKDSGSNLIDMPMTGGRIAAESGQLTLLAGGDQGVIEALRPELKAIAKEITYFGPTGSGTKYKLLLNTLQALHIAGFAEVMKLAADIGLDQEKVGKALVKRPGGILTEIAWEGYQNQPEPISFSVDWIAKDLKYALEMAGNRPHELLDQVSIIYKKLADDQHGSEDWTYVTKI